jgi:hypothetical protein
MTGPVHRKPQDQDEITDAAPPTEAIRMSTASRAAIVSVPVPLTTPDTPELMTTVHKGVRFAVVPMAGGTALIDRHRIDTQKVRKLYTLGRQ